MKSLFFSISNEKMKSLFFQLFKICKKIEFFISKLVNVCKNLNSYILAFKSLGIKQIKVKKKINILFFSTGNEISNKDNIPNWMVRNSNTHYIKNLNQNFLFNFKSGSILRDNHQIISTIQRKCKLPSKVLIVGIWRTFLHC